jgi:hypothetical protein
MAKKEEKDVAGPSLNKRFCLLKRKEQMKDGNSFIAELRSILSNVRGRWICNSDSKPILLMTAELITDLATYARRHALRTELTQAQKKSFSQVAEFLRGLLSEFNVTRSGDEIAGRVTNKINEFTIKPARKKRQSSAA